MGEVTIPLRLKYRNPSSKTEMVDGMVSLVWIAEKHAYKSRTGNSYGPTPKRSKSTSGNGKRKVAYGPF